jgi:hypothetical protein
LRPHPNGSHSRDLINNDEKAFFLHFVDGEMSYISDETVAAAQFIQLTPGENGLSPSPLTQLFGFLQSYMDRDHAITDGIFVPRGKQAESTLEMNWAALSFRAGHIESDTMRMRQTKSTDPPVFDLYNGNPSSYQDRRAWGASNDRTQKGNGADLFHIFGVQEGQMHLYLPYRIENGRIPSNSKRFALFVLHHTDEVNERRALEQHGLFYIESFRLIKGKTWPRGWFLLEKMFLPDEIEWLRNQHAGGGHSNEDNRTTLGGLHAPLNPALARLNNQTFDEVIDLTDEIDIIDLT